MTGVRIKIKNKNLSLQLQFQELDTRQESVKHDEEFHRNLEEKAQARSEEMNLKFASDLEMARKENQLLVEVVEDLRAVVRLIFFNN